jgi:hypothetical protein
MTMAELKVRITGKAPLLLHNGRLADPTDEVAREMKKITAKRTKTDEDHLELSRLEFTGGLYTDENGEPCIPGEVLESCLKSGAKVAKNGKKIEAGAFVSEYNVPLQYPGPRDADALWADKRFVHRSGVKVGQARVMRTRPKFDKWACEFTVEYQPEVINREEVVRALEDAGNLKGLCDYRPRHGRFNVEVLSV